jgi:hypothetical protein
MHLTGLFLTGDSPIGGPVTTQDNLCVLNGLRTRDPSVRKVQYCTRHRDSTA